MLGKDIAKAGLVDYAATHPQQKEQIGGPAISRTSPIEVPPRLRKFMTRLTEQGLLVTGKKERKVREALRRVTLTSERTSRIKRWIRI